MDAQLPAVRALDQESAVPLFHQLVARLREDILSGAYRPHDQLPSEPALCRLYQVSRATVRLALDKLVEQQLVYRRHGKGTFVKPPEPQLALLTDPSFAREMRLRGIEPSLRTIIAKRAPMPAGVARYFRDTDGQGFYVKRLILGDGVPWGLARMYFHPGTRLGSQHFESGQLMIELLQNVGLRIVDAHYLYIEPVLINDRQADLLDVRPGAAGLDVARLLIDQTGRVAVHARTLFRGDRCRALFSSREAGTTDAGSPWDEGEFEKRRSGVLVSAGP